MNRDCKKISLKAAFTLPEVIVALSVLVMVIMASTTVVINVIRGNQDNQDTLIAYGLAQEALEGLRNIRDSNWLLGADFYGNIESTCVWGECLPSSSYAGQKRYFIIDRKNSDGSAGGAVSSEEIRRYAPWKLKDITVSGGADETAARLFSFENGFLGHISAYLSESTMPVKFYRYLEITPKQYGGDSLSIAKYEVFSVVKWKDGSRDRTMRIGTELTNWKGGKL